MADYRRCYVAGGSFFFTVVIERRAPILGNDAAHDLLRAAFRDCLDRWPFRVDALVMLPDHLHAIWTLPPDDADYSKRWGAIKKWNIFRDRPRFPIQQFLKRRVPQANWRLRMSALAPGP